MSKAGKSLAAQGGAVESPTLPSSFAPKENFQQLPVLRESTPFVQFAHPKSPNYGDLISAIPSLKEGDPVLVLPRPDEPILLNPFRFYLVHYYPYYADIDQAGNILRATEDAEIAAKNPKLKQSIEAVVMVVTGETIVPARCTFRTTKCGAAITAISTGQQAAGDQWGKLSPEHELTLKVNDPRFRFLTTVHMGVRTSKENGSRYYPAYGRVAPTGPADWILVSGAMKTPGFGLACDAVTAAWEKRVSDVRAKIK